MNKKYNLIIFFVCGAFFLSGCAVTKLAKRVVVGTGKVAWTTVRSTGKLVKTLVLIPGKRKVVKLKKEGNTLLVNALLNRRVKAVLVLDTGATSTQISPRIAKKLRINWHKGEKVKCTLADGNIVTGREVLIRELRLNRVRACNIRAIVLDNNNTTEDDGLLGMSFLNNFTFKIDPEKAEMVLEKKKK
jgi:clan AA aspartic protease (TIGR02281 family)